jgi:predicted nucleotidyltransferase
MKTDNTFGLRPDTLADIQDVLIRFPEVQKCVVYGSRAMGNYRHNSDIDLVLVGENLTLTDLLRIETELEELLLPYQIDLSIFNQIDNPDLVKHIKEHGKSLFEKSSELT